MDGCAGRVIDGAVSGRLVEWLARVLAFRWMRGWRHALVVGHWARRRRLKTCLRNWSEVRFACKGSTEQVPFCLLLVWGIASHPFGLGLIAIP